MDANMGTLQTLNSLAEIQYAVPNADVFYFQLGILCQYHLLTVIASYFFRVTLLTYQRGLLRLRYRNTITLLFFITQTMQE
jgi:hypothetical protein